MGSDDDDGAAVEDATDRGRRDRLAEESPREYGHVRYCGRRAPFGSEGR